MQLYLIWVFINNVAVVFQLVDNSSIMLERVFSHVKRTMTADRNAMGNMYLEGILMCKFNQDLLALSKQTMLKRIYEMVDENQ